MSANQEYGKPSQAETTGETASEDQVAVGTAAFENFCTPALSYLRSEDHDELVKRARHHLRNAQTVRVNTSVGELQTYIFQPENPPLANVLVVHGWTGEAAFMGVFGDFLRRRGYRAILMDMPAHGQSEGDWASLFDCATGVLEVAEYFSPVQFALGHSIGAMAAATAGEGHFPLKSAYPFEAYALISMPDAFKDVTRHFGAKHNLSPQAQRVYEGHLEKLAGRPISEFSGVQLLSATARPTLLMHSRDDVDVSFSCAENMTANVPNTQLLPFDGLGHRAILYAPPIARAVVSFFEKCLED